jgi:hypothetical protein
VAWWFFGDCREWYGYHFPELAKIVGDNTSFARIAHLIGRRSTASDELYVNPLPLVCFEMCVCGGVRHGPQRVVLVFSSPFAPCFFL